MPRPADAAVAISRLITTVTHDVHEKGGNPYKEARNFSQALELMAVMSYVLVTTADGEPRNATDIARHIGIPRTSVQRQLKKLETSGRLKSVGNVYIADLEFYDELVTSERLQEWHEQARAATVALRRLRALFS